MPSIRDLVKQNEQRMASSGTGENKLFEPEAPRPDAIQPGPPPSVAGLPVRGYYPQGTALDQDFQGTTQITGTGVGMRSRTFPAQLPPGITKEGVLSLIKASNTPGSAVANATQPTASTTPATSPGVTSGDLMALSASVVTTVAGIADAAVTAAYRPLSNPLSATGTTITISAFTMRTTQAGDLSINSGSITSLTAGTTYFVYYDDPSLLGGAVTFQSSTTRGDALDAVGRFFVGSIVIPMASSGNTNVGFNDGGFGAAQLANTVIYTDAVTASSTGSVTGVGNEKDGSFADAVVFVAQSGTALSSIRFENYTLPYPLGLPNSLVLNVNYGAVKSGGAGVVGWLIQYSINGGSSFTTIDTNTGSQGQTTGTVSLSASQDLSQVQIFAEATWTSGGTTVMTFSVYEAWIVAQY